MALPMPRRKMSASSSAIRQRRRRERERDGRILLAVAVREHELAQVLIAAAFLDPDDASRAGLTRALEKVIELWADENNVTRDF